jgi:phosphoribosylformylglycinamidine cyclo-ligase
LRALKDGLGAKIKKSAVQTPDIFGVIAQAGGVPERDMFNTFNMGVGMVAVVPGAQADLAVRTLRAAGENAYVLGEIAVGDGVELW